MVLPPLVKKLVGDIRFWIVLYFLIRLIGITNPPIEVSQSWRQAIVNTVARNFVEVDNNILYPTLDHSGSKSGISAMEFPLLNYLIYLFHLLFGYEHWYGRLINLIVSSFGVYFFYKFLQISSSAKTAFWGSFILLNTLWFSYSQKIMPDTFACSLVLASIYFGYHYFLKNRKPYLLLFGVLLCVGMLSKITAGAVLLLLIPPILFCKTQNRKKVILVLTAAIAVLPVFWWYFIWSPHLYSLSGFLPVNYQGTSSGDNFQNLMDNFLLIMDAVFVGTLNLVSLVLFLISIVIVGVEKNSKMLLLLMLNLFGIGIIVLKTSELQYHSYYLLPFIPFFAYLAAQVFTYTNKKWLVLLLGVGIMIDGIASQYHNLLLKEKNLYRLELETIADKIADDSKLIIINGGDNPSDIYFTNRKGWTIPKEKVTIQYLQELKAKGAIYFYCLYCEADLERYEKVFTNEWLTVYKISE